MSVLTTFPRGFLSEFWLLHCRYGQHQRIKYCNLMLFKPSINIFRQILPLFFDIIIAYPTRITASWNRNDKVKKKRIISQDLYNKNSRKKLKSITKIKIHLARKQNTEQKISLNRATQLFSTSSYRTLFAFCVKFSECSEADLELLQHPRWSTLW